MNRHEAMAKAASYTFDWSKQWASNFVSVYNSAGKELCLDIHWKPDINKGQCFDLMVDAGITVTRDKTGKIWVRAEYSSTKKEDYVGTTLMFSDHNGDITATTMKAINDCAEEKGREM